MPHSIYGQHLNCFCHWGCWQWCLLCLLFSNPLPICIHAAKRPTLVLAIHGIHPRSVTVLYYCFHPNGHSAFKEPLICTCAAPNGSGNFYLIFWYFIRHLVWICMSAGMVCLLLEGHACLAGDYGSIRMIALCINEFYGAALCGGITTSTATRTSYSLLMLVRTHCLLGTPILRYSDCRLKKFQPTERSCRSWAVWWNAYRSLRSAGTWGK